MVQEDSARKRLEALLDALANLRRFRDEVTRDQLARDKDTQYKVLYGLFLACQSAVDLALHRAAACRLELAASYADAFHRLADAGQLERELAERLAGWARLRNVVAHFYPVIDFDRVHQALGELYDLERFAQIAGNWFA